MSLLTGQVQLCPICNGQKYTTFFALPEVPTQDGMLWKSRTEALTAPTGEIKLAFCHACGYIGNVAFEPHKIRYDQDYTFSMYFSPTFREFITAVAQRLIDRFDLRNKRVLEIGCGEGDFVRLLCELGANDGVGIDPIAKARVEQVGDRQVTFLQDWYNENYANLDVDLICCRQALDQMPQPKAIIELMRRNIGARSNTAVYVEIPNAASIFEDMLIRNIMYEKSSWFTLHSITRLFELSGFKIVAAEPCFDGGQYLSVEALPATEPIPVPMGEEDAVKQFAQSVQAFSENHQRKIKSWRERLASIQQAGQRAIAWGSGAGGISFFSMLKITEEIPYVVDINPKRQGRFLPLTGQEVVPPDFLPSYYPDVVIITNATYEQEIKQQVAAMGIDCDFWAI